MFQPLRVPRQGLIDLRLKYDGVARAVPVVSREHEPSVELHVHAVAEIFLVHGLSFRSCTAWIVAHFPRGNQESGAAFIATSKIFPMAASENWRSSLMLESLERSQSRSCSISYRIGPRSWSNCASSGQRVFTASSSAMVSRASCNLNPL